MANLRATKILPIALILIVVAIAIAVIFSLVRFIFFSNAPTNTAVDNSQTVLLSPDANNSVVLNVRGPIVADEDFRSYQIKITPSSRELDTYKGYSNNIVDKVVLPNTNKEYEQFVYALYRANLVRGVELKGKADDLRGICASGRVYEFSVLSGQKVEKHLWTSTCSASLGSLSASNAQLVDLFALQIPNSTDIITSNW